MGRHSYVNIRGQKYKVLHDDDPSILSPSGSCSPSSIISLAMVYGDIISKMSLPVKKVVYRRRDTGVFLFPFVAMLLGTMLMLMESLIHDIGVDGPIIIGLGTMLMWFSWCKYHEVMTLKSI